MENHSKFESPFRHSDDSKLVSSLKSKKLFILSSSLLTGFGHGSLQLSDKFPSFGNLIFSKLNMLQYSKQMPIMNLNVLKKRKD